MDYLSFSAKIFTLGINPCVDIPQDILKNLFDLAGKDNGPIPVCGRLNGKAFVQTVVKYKGAWRLYINNIMRESAKVDAGDNATIEITFDQKPRTVPMPTKLSDALKKSKKAKTAFEQLSPSHQKEILKYLNSMKTEESLLRNIEKVMQHLMGERPKGLYALMRTKS